MTGESPNTTVSTELAAAGEEPSVAEMIELLHNKTAEIETIEEETFGLLESWIEAMTFFAWSKKDFELNHPRDLDIHDNGHHIEAAQDLFAVDMEAAGHLTNIYKNARLEYKLVDELEMLAVKLKVKSFVELGDSGVYDLAEEAERKVQQCRNDLRERPTELLKLRQEIMDDSPW